MRHALPCQGPLTELLSMNLSNPFLNLPGSGVASFSRGALRYVDGVFSIKDVWEWDLLGSLTSNAQQFRMKLLGLCSGLHEKTPT